MRSTSSVPLTFTECSAENGSNQCTRAVRQEVSGFASDDLPTSVVNDQRNGTRNSIHIRVIHAKRRFRQITCGQSVYQHQTHCGVTWNGFQTRRIAVFPQHVRFQTALQTHATRFSVVGTNLQSLVSTRTQHYTETVLTWHNTRRSVVRSSSDAIRNAPRKPEAPVRNTSPAL